VASITEQEIWKGILDSDVNDVAEQKTMCFVRSFQQYTPINTKYAQNLRKYFDLLEPFDAGQLDPIAVTMLNDLKNFALPEKLDDTNLFRYSLPMDEQLGMNPQLPLHTKYLKDLVSKFTKTMKELITEGLVANASQGNDPLFVEVNKQAEFARNKSKIYCGRDDWLQMMYTKLGDKNLREPIVIYGDSGVGKTATVAKLVMLTWNNVLGKHAPYRPTTRTFRHAQCGLSISRYHTRQQQSTTIACLAVYTHL
jgi:ATP-dependent Clp protease ATP-binding subunit ClpA